MDSEIHGPLHRKNTASGSAVWSATATQVQLGMYGRDDSPLGGSGSDSGGSVSQLLEDDKSLGKTPRQPPHATATLPLGNDRDDLPMRPTNFSSSPWSQTSPQSRGSRNSRGVSPETLIAPVPQRGPETQAHVEVHEAASRLTISAAFWFNAVKVGALQEQLLRGAIAAAADDAIADFEDDEFEIRRDLLAALKRARRARQTSFSPAASPRQQVQPSCAHVKAEEEKQEQLLRGGVAATAALAFSLVATPQSGVVVLRQEPMAQTDESVASWSCTSDDDVKRRPGRLGMLPDSVASPQRLSPATSPQTHPPPQIVSLQPACVSPPPPSSPSLSPALGSSSISSSSVATLINVAPSDAVRQLCVPISGTSAAVPHIAPVSNKILMSVMAHVEAADRQARDALWRREVHARQLLLGRGGARSPKMSPRDPPMSVAEAAADVSPLLLVLLQMEPLSRDVLLAEESRLRSVLRNVVDGKSPTLR
jgi:hypothetical protein